jgi:hypothetical protein
LLIGLLFIVYYLLFIIYLFWKLIAAKQIRSREAERKGTILRKDEKDSIDGEDVFPVLA